MERQSLRDSAPAAGKNIVNSWIYIAVWAVVIGALFGYLWWQGQVRRFAVYIQETREELKKCSWPSWEELKGSTLLITISIILLGLFIFLVDQVLMYIFFKKGLFGLFS